MYGLVWQAYHPLKKKKKRNTILISVGSQIDNKNSLLLIRIKTKIDFF